MRTAKCCVEEGLSDRFRCLVRGLEILDVDVPKQSVKIVDFTLIDAHSAPDPQGLMRSPVEVRSAACTQRLGLTAKCVRVTQRPFLSRDVPKKSEN